MMKANEKWISAFFFLTSAGLVGKLNPKNKVDLTNPELTVIVEVIKAVCCISVVKDYTLYRKYNVQEVVKEETAKAPEEPTAKKESNADEQKETNRQQGKGEEDTNVPKGDEEVNKGESNGE